MQDKNCFQNLVARKSVLKIDEYVYLYLVLNLLRNMLPKAVNVIYLKGYLHTV